jgi:D-sedoheptulose 7-phosphate isomerase
MFAKEYMEEFFKAIQLIDINKIEALAIELAKLKISDGRLFILGVGGSAANASHAVNDFRKLDNIEAYAPTDNIYELTARTNDEGWSSIFYKWLGTSKLNERDALLILSVGGGSKERDLSTNLVFAARYAKAVKAKVYCILGKDGGDVLEFSDLSIITDIFSENLITPIAESLQSVILHLLVSYDFLKENKTTW